MLVALRERSFTPSRRVSMQHAGPSPGSHRLPRKHVKIRYAMRNKWGRLRQNGLLGSRRALHLHLFDIGRAFLRGEAAAHRHRQCHQRYTYVKEERSIPYIPFVELFLFLLGNELTAVDLRPTADPRTHRKPDRSIIGLVLRQQRPRPDKRHLAKK